MPPKRVSLPATPEEGVGAAAAEDEVVAGAGVDEHGHGHRDGVDRVVAAAGVDRDAGEGAGGEGRGVAEEADVAGPVAGEAEEVGVGGAGDRERAVDDAGGGPGRGVVEEAPEGDRAGAAGGEDGLAVGLGEQIRAVDVPAGVEEEEAVVGERGVAGPGGGQADDGLGLAAGGGGAAGDEELAVGLGTTASPESPAGWPGR
ncbi:MAG: hypothetical protein QM755_21320 [Luteolibacter sp.]